MHKFVFHNDRLLPVSEVRLSPGQYGLLCGWGVFTTVRTYGGRPFAFERHWQRLKRDACRIELPLGFDERFVRSRLEELLAANQVGDGCVRIYLVKNRGGIWSSDELAPETDLIMYSIDLPVRVGPTKLGVMEYGRYAAHPLAGTKVISWLDNVWSVEQAHHAGVEDNVLLNERGEVSECTAANIYCVRDGKICTPPLSSGCLAGISREVLLETAPRNGVTIVEQNLTLGQFYSADEVFITSTTREVQPVRRIGERDVPVVFGPVTVRLAEIFNNYVKEYIQGNQQ